jgi:small subunit ribosomal protein S17
MNTRGLKKRVHGIVKSSAMDKTISVIIERRVKHPKYGKYLTKSSVFKAHDENNEAQKGDRVELTGTRPLSKTKCWRLVKVMEKAPKAQS